MELYLTWGVLISCHLRSYRTKPRGAAGLAASRAQPSSLTYGLRIQRKPKSFSGCGVSHRAHLSGCRDARTEVAALIHRLQLSTGSVPEGNALDLPCEAINLPHARIPIIQQRLERSTESKRVVLRRG